MKQALGIGTLAALLGSTASALAARVDYLADYFHHVVSELCFHHPF